jgi:hypothetical protein
MTEQAALIKEIDGLYKSIKTDLARDPAGLKDELAYRCSWLARSAELKADAQFYLDKKRGEIAEIHIGTKESWSVVKQLIEAQSRDERRILELADRLNATLTHQMDSIRSILSFEKQTLANEKGS